MKSTKFYMWVTKIDNEKNCLWAEGYIIDGDKKLSKSLSVSEIDLEWLKETLNDGDYKEMTKILGQIFYVEQFEDGTETIELKRDNRTPEEIEKVTKSAKKWVDNMFKKLKWE